MAYRRCVGTCSASGPYTFGPGRSFNREFEQKQDELLGEVARKVGEVASEYGRENGYDAIFLYNAQPLAFIAEGANVTDIVIERYNQRFPVE